MGLSGSLATESKFRPVVHATSRHGTPSLTSLSKDNEVSCEVQASEVTHREYDLTRPSLTSVTWRRLFKPLGHSIRFLAQHHINDINFLLSFRGQFTDLFGSKD